MSQSETDIIRDIRSDYGYGWHVDDVSTIYKAPKGLSHGLIDIDLRPQERAGLDAGVPAQEPRLLPRPADAELGRGPLRHRLRQHPLLRQADREAGRQVGRSPGRDPRHVGPARDPRGGEEVPRRRRRAVRVRGRLPQAAGGPRAQGRDLPRHGLRAAASTRSSSASTSRRSSRRTTTSSPPSTRPSGRAARSSTCRRRLDRDAAPGLLPHQRGEHGPVRAHADHRRRGRVRALRRGLHRADLLVATRCTRRSSRSSSSRVAAAATPRSRTGRTTSTTSSRSAPSPTRTRRWSGSTATSARR